MSIDTAPAAKPTHFLLQGPVTPLLIRMSIPTIAVMLIQGLVSTAEVYFVGRLGSEAIAGVALCYPVLMLMMSMSAAGLGSGVSSAIARAIGGGRQREAEALVFDGLFISVGVGIVFSVVMHFGGPWLYSRMGGSDATLRNAIRYSSVFFNSAILVWVFNTLTSAFRGVGAVKFPAAVGAAGGAIIIIASPSMIFGLGPFPAMGIVGASLAIVCFYVIGIIVMAWKLFSPSSPLRPHWSAWEFNGPRMWEILRVGLPSSVNTIITSGNAIMMTGLVGPFGSAALAGFGLSTRLEYIMAPIIFGFGTSVITIVGASVGAGNFIRAREATQTGALIAAVFTGTIGLTLAFFPDLWLRLFTQDPSVLAIGEAYFHRVGPVYVCFGLGMICYAAAQGLGRAVIPMWIALFRLLFIAPVGIWAGRIWGVNGVFAVMASGYAFFGLSLSAIMAWLFRTLSR